MTSLTSQTKLRRSLIFIGVFFILICSAVLTSYRFPVTTSGLAEDDTLCLGNSTIPQYVIEAGKASTYTLQLCNSPLEPVTVTIKPAVGHEVYFTVEPITRTLHFNSENWNRPARVSLIPVDDELIQQSTFITIEHVTTSADPAFHSPISSVLTINVHIIGNIWIPLVFNPIPPTPTPIPPTPTPIPPTPEWRQLSLSPKTADTLALSSKGLFAGGRDTNNADNGIYKNTSCGTLNRIQPNIPVYGLAFQGAAGLAATNGSKVYFSTNGGDSWNQTSSNMNRAAYAVVLTNGGAAYAGTDDGLYTSGNAGQSWDKINGGPARVNELVYDSTLNSIWILTYGNGVWRYNLGSRQFTEHNGGLTDTNKERRVWDLALLPSGEMYIATNNGIYRGNGTGNWISTFLEMSIALTVEVGNNEKLYVGTSGSGVWQYDLQTKIAIQLSLQKTLIVSDLLYDNQLCDALLAATNDGIWIYR